MSIGLLVWFVPYVPCWNWIQFRYTSLMFTNPVNSTVDIRQMSPLFRWVWNTSQRWLNRRMSANHQQYGSLREVNLFNHGNGQIPNLHPVEVVKRKTSPSRSPKIKGVLVVYWIYWGADWLPKNHFFFHEAFGVRTDPEPSGWDSATMSGELDN